MKSKTTTVTEAQIEDLVALLVNNKSMVALEREDVMSVVEGKNCKMFEAIQEEEGREEFFRLIEDELYQDSVARDCQSMLVCFVGPELNDLSMDELCSFLDLLMKVSPDADVVWGTTSGNGTDRLKVIMIAGQSTDIDRRTSDV